jgi:hypothetical protein
MSIRVSSIFSVLGVMLLACGGAGSHSRSGRTVAAELAYVDKSAGDTPMTGVVLRPSWAAEVDLGTYAGVCTAERWRRADAPAAGAGRVVAGTLCATPDATTYVALVWEGGNLVAYMNEQPAGETPDPETGWIVKGRVEVPADVGQIEAVGEPGK